jgi:CRP-like cAMP-binding protein
MPGNDKRTPVASTVSQNNLVARLPRRQRDNFLDQCQLVELVRCTVLCEAGDPVAWAYFPLRGCISLTTDLPSREPLETSSIGREGMHGAMLILGLNQAPQRAVVLARCPALRLESRKLRELTATDPAFLRILQRYLAVILAELPKAIACMHFHTASQRLARRLLLAHDHVEADELCHFPHRTLAALLGVQRGAITLAAADLQRQGIIRYRRGRILVLDRAGLEKASCGCYQDARGRHAALLPRSRRSAPPAQ